MTWLHSPSPTEYKQGSALFLQALDQYHIQKIVLDNSQRGNPMPEELLWISHEIVPAICAQKVQQLAFVVPPDPHHARHFECCLMTADVCYELQFFYSQQEALLWLRHYSQGRSSKAVA